jgi:hypothetical protein
MQRERFREAVCTNLIHRSGALPVFFVAEAWASLWLIFIGFPEWNGVYTFSFTDLLSEVTVQNTSRDTNGHSANQEMQLISVNLEAHYCIHKKGYL